MEARRGVAIVTGAGSGIGRAVALKLLAAGYLVVLAGRRPEPLETTVSAGAVPERSLAVPTDVTDPAAVDALFARATDRFGRVDLLFNNAGMGHPATPLEEIDFATWQKVVATNLTGPFLCTQAAMRQMKAQQPQGGRIINNGSISAHVPRPLAGAYTATKHAITGLTRATSLEGRRYDIACGQVDIGNAASEMTEQMFGGVLQADGAVRAEPVMDVEAVADGVLYMAGLPPQANVQFMTVMATKMPFIGRG